MVADSMRLAMSLHVTFVSKSDTSTMQHLTNCLPNPKIRLLQATLTTIDKRWTYNLRSPFWRLYLNDQDGAMIEDQGQQYAMRAGCIYLLPAWGNFRSSCRNEVKHFFLHFDPVGWDLWARQHCTRMIALPNDPVLDTLAQGLMKNFNQPESGLHCEALLCLALANLIPLLPAESLAELATHGQPDPVLSKAFDLLNQHPTKNIPVSVLAKSCNLSPDHFTRRFKTRTGSTPDRYEAERRISRSAEQLLADDSDISSIAEANGFANRYHFTRVFTRLMGQSPAMYRKSRCVQRSGECG